MMNEESDDLICPITLQLFRDPVKAKDGHVYERLAITKWILEHGTSPLTREPLTLNDLQSDEHIKQLIKQRRNSTVSFNVENQSVRIENVSQRLSTNHRINPSMNSNLRRYYSYKLILFLIIVSFIIPLSFIFGIYFGLINSLIKPIEIISVYSNDFNSNNLFNRSIPNSSFYYNYKLIDLNLSIDGFYGFEIESRSINSIDGDLYIHFYNQSSQSLTYSYKDKNYSKTYFGINLQSNKYILMLTTYFCCNPGGSFTIRITGPQKIIF